MYPTGYRTGVELVQALGRIASGRRPWPLDSESADDPDFTYAQSLSVASTDDGLVAVPHWDAELLRKAVPFSHLLTALDSAQIHVARLALPLAAICTIASDELHILLITREPCVMPGPLLGRVTVQFEISDGQIAIAAPEVESWGHPIEPFIDGLRDAFAEGVVETLTRSPRPDVCALGRVAGHVVAEVLSFTIDGKRSPVDGYAIWREPGEPQVIVSPRDHEHFRRWWYHRQPPLNGATLAYTRRVDELFLHVPSGWAEPGNVSILLGMRASVKRKTIKTSDWSLDAGADVSPAAVERFVTGVHEGFASHPRSNELVPGFGALI